MPGPARYAHASIYLFFFQGPNLPRVVPCVGGGRIRRLEQIRRLSRHCRWPLASF